MRSNMGILAQAGGGPKIPVPSGTVTETITTGSSNPKTFNLPTVIAGDLLILYITNNGNGTPSNVPTGWTALYGPAANMEIAYRICDGSEGSTAQFNMSNAAQNPTCSVVKIDKAKWDGTAPPEIGTSTTATTTPNPPSVTASWGAGINNLVLAGCQTDGVAVTSISAFPSGYTDYYNGGQTNGLIRLAYTNSVVAANDPGTFTINSSSATILASTILVKGS